MALLLQVSAFAGEDLTPTDLKSAGDCVSPRILAPTSRLQSRLDRQYCVDGNAGDAEAMQACLRYVARKSQVTFFWDNCSSPDGPFFFSIGGREYTLKKTAGSGDRHVPVAGLYEADGLSVSIRPGRLLRRSRCSGEGVGDEEFEVAIVIRRGGDSFTSRGVYWSAC